MKPTRTHIAHRFATLLISVACAIAVAHAGDSGVKEIGRTTERELNVVLSTPFGKLIISKGEPEKILEGSLIGANEASHELQFDYTIRNRTGYLELSLGEPNQGDGKKGTIKLSDFKSSKWDLKFTRAIPISFDVELGLAKGEFDLSGLQVKDFNLSCGASDVVISFDKPNAASLGEMNIECGVGKFEGRNLGNANFKHFRFEGGVGAATLDFSGAIKNEVDVDVEVGLGVCTVILPKEIGARVFHEESLVSRIDLAKDIRSSNENEYISDNYRSATGRMNLRISASLGSVKVKRK